MKLRNLVNHFRGDVWGDFWGGLAAMLVALPSAIAFGVTIFAPLGTAYGSYGALAGILGVTALGLVASAFGGTRRLITAPCAPAAAVLSAFALEFIRGGASAETVLFLLFAISVLSALLQISYGAAGLGRLIKYMPYPVVSGYMTGVGLIIIGSQVPKLLGIHGGGVWEAVSAPGAWSWQSIFIGGLTAVVMVGAPRLTKRVPAAILALAAGVIALFSLGLFDPALLTLSENHLVIGPMIGGTGDGSFLTALSARIAAFRDVRLDQLAALAIPALTLSVLLSIDTLKTCVVIDAMTRSRHNSNRELVGQGLGNLTAALAGGIPGAGTMGATLVNLSSGAVSRLSGTIEGLLALTTFLMLGSLIAWVPIASLAAILIVVGVRMIDVRVVQLAKSRYTVLDAAVIVAVICVALFIGLIPASGTGIALAILLFIRGQLKSSVIRRKIGGNESFSRRNRTQEDLDILTAQGGQAVILELQGSLFFGTADQLYTILEPEIKTRKYIVLDMRRVQTIDITVAHWLEQVREMMSEKGGFLVYSRLPTDLPSGQNIELYVDKTGLAPYKSAARIFSDLDDAKAWIENRILKQAAGTLKHSRAQDDEEIPLSLHEIEMFKGRKLETLDALAEHLVEISCPRGAQIYSRGEIGAQLYFVRKGVVSLNIPIGGGHTRRLYTITRGSFFGEATFLNAGAHSTNATAETDVELFVLSRESLDAFSEKHKKAAINLLQGLGSLLVNRLRFLTSELMSLDS